MVVLLPILCVTDVLVLPTRLLFMVSKNRCHLCLTYLICFLNIMKTLLFLASSLLAFSFCSCKSVGYHVDGKSTIVRNDTVHVSVVGDKPVVVDQIVR